MQLFYIPSLTTSDPKAIFSKEESKHIYKVLRKKSGDAILAQEIRVIGLKEKVVNLETITPLRNLIQMMIFVLEIILRKPKRIKGI